jgi:hypothetical protein
MLRWTRGRCVLRHSPARRSGDWDHGSPCGGHAAGLQVVTLEKECTGCLFSKESAGGVPPTLGASGRELQLAGVFECRLDRVDQACRAVMDGDHARAERLGIVQPVGDVVEQTAA